MTIVIGIDVGLTGAVARIGGGLPTRIEDLKTVPDGAPRAGKGNKEFQPMRLCGLSLLLLLRELAPAGHVALAVIEDVKARPMGNGESHFNSFHSQNSLVLSRGAIQAVLDIAGISTHAVQPQTWKKLFGLGGADKDDSLEMARRLYPSLVADLRLKKHHNRAESLLIAHFGEKRLT